VVARNLQLTVLDMELLYQLLKHVGRLRHEFLGFLLRHHFAKVNLWDLKIREQENEDFESISRNLDEIHGPTNVMEVTIEDLSFCIYSLHLSIFQWHGGRALLSNYVDLIL
jgi:hypothetical protein